jgi:hypothetical protein
MVCPKRTQAASGKRVALAGIPAVSSTTTSKSPEPRRVPRAESTLLTGVGGAPRSQSRRVRSTPAAEAAAGSRWSPTSTQAPRPPSRVTRATREQTSPVRPEEGGPWTSEIRPRGKPPPRSASIEEIPVGSGEGPRSSPRRGGASAWSRRARRRSWRELLTADDTVSPFLRHMMPPGRRVVNLDGRGTGSNKPYGGKRSGIARSKGAAEPCERPVTTRERAERRASGAIPPSIGTR